jgi:hypothetical protein
MSAVSQGVFYSFNLRVANSTFARLLALPELGKVRKP